MNYELTVHAQESLNKRRNIRLEWLERVLERPQLIEADALDAELEHRLGKIDEFEGWVLRVIVNPHVEPVRVITVFFDRAMRGKL
ncbi:MULTISPECIES: DUF4258 domain-containing protein [Methylomicrobium]|uniref:DUF4258 domain-containing protein n=1 Tax=Methylomicrobium album BG8 TaxID=686340 RepID=H8GQQ3_METAL|nr:MULTISPECIES: DUF4258 domain-containing protein [Methylomicrobium]EIC31038.1 hypothetical protein Metal_3378 [Methylomicrobium album BG8]